MIDGINTGAVSGKLMGLTINGIFVSCETECSFNWEVEMIPVSPLSEGRWADNVAGIRRWSMSVDGNLLLKTVGADIKTVLNAVMTGEYVDIEFRTRANITPYLIISGKALPSSGGITAPRRGKSTWNVEFVGCGKFTTDVEEFWLLINNMPIDNNYQSVVNMNL